MAINISSKYLKNNVFFPKNRCMYFILKVGGFIDLLRYFKRILRFKKDFHINCWPEDIVHPSFEQAKDHYARNRWVFKDEVFLKDFHQDLVDQWPSNDFFSAPRHAIKSYNIGFRWVRTRSSAPEFIDLHPAVAHLFKCLTSDRFAKRVQQFAGAQEEMACCSFLLNTTYPGSQVVPHLDSIANNPNASPYLNIVFFINGSGGEQSGGLAIIEDNNFEEVIYEPENLFNTCLIYDSIAPFYHGFKPVAFGKFRWAVASQFCKKSLLSK